MKDKRLKYSNTEDSKISDPEGKAWVWFGIRRHEYGLGWEGMSMVWTQFGLQ